MPSVSPKLSQNRNWLNFILFSLLFTLVAIPRVLPFPHAFLAPDEMKIGVWVSEMAVALTTGDWAETAITNNPYPAVTLAWLEALRLKLSPPTGDPLANETVFANLSHQRFRLGLLNTLIILALLWLLSRLYHDGIALTAGLLMALDPFFLTESRVFRTEGLTTGLMMLSALTVILYTQNRHTRWLVLSAVLAALAALTRVSAFYLVPFAALVLAVSPLLRGQPQLIPWLKSIMLDILGWSLITGATFIMLWPALWASPLAGPGKLYTAIAPVFADTGRVWAKGVFFNGHPMGNIDPGPMFYVWALLYRTSPLVWLGLLLFVGAGVALLLAQFTKSTWLARFAAPLKAHYPVTLLLIAYLGFYLIAINLSATKIDRYLVAILPALAILAAVGFWLTLTFLTGATPWSQGGLWAGLLLTSLWLAMPHHPYYYTYWNPLLGGGPAAVKILPVTFRLGIDPLVDYLNTFPDAAQLSLSGPPVELDQDCQVIFSGTCTDSPHFLSSDYFWLTRYARQHKLILANIQTIIPDVQLTRTFSQAGVEYAWLYKMPVGLQDVGQWLDRSAGMFSGYRLSAPEVAAGESTQVTLFWQNGENNGWQFADSELYVKVLDETGQVQTLAAAHLKPEFEPSLSQPQEILVFTATLTFAPDTPLGFYPLEIGLRLKESGQETLKFSLSDPLNGASSRGSARGVTVNRGALNSDSLSIQYPIVYPIELAGLTLLGYDLPQTGPPRLDLYWQADPLPRPTENYLIQVDWLDDKGQPLTTWRKPVAPANLTTWQPGEVIKQPFALEVGYPLPAEAAQARVSVFSETGDTLLDSLELSPLPPGVGPARPAVNTQHRLDEVSFGAMVDLLGYDLLGKSSNASAGDLFVRLYWLNRWPEVPLEAQVEVLAENGAVIAQQRLPVLPPTHHLTWQSVNFYQLPLDTLPAVIQIKVKPVAGQSWLMTLANTDTVVIDDILNKTTPVQE